MRPNHSLNRTHCGVRPKALHFILGPWPHAATVRLAQTLGLAFSYFVFFSGPSHNRCVRNSRQVQPFHHQRLATCAQSQFVKARRPAISARPQAFTVTRSRRAYSFTRFPRFAKSHQRGLTIHSTGHFAACRVWPSFHSGPNPTHRKVPVSSNVRPH